MVSRPGAQSAAALALALVVHIGSRLVFKWRRSKRYDGLDSALNGPCMLLDLPEHSVHAATQTASIR